MALSTARSPSVTRRTIRTGQAQVASVLGTAILRGDFPTGTNLPCEADLTTRFGVSRTVIREVMKTLAAKGMVVAKTKIGTRVAERLNWNMFDADVLNWRLKIGIDRSFMQSLFEIRQALEPAAAALAALNRSDEDVAKMRAIVATMRAAGHTHASFADVDLELHLAVAAASGNPFMRAIGAIIETALTASFAISSPVEQPERQRQSAIQHEAIVEAIATRDPEAARAAMMTVIGEAVRNADFNRASDVVLP
ncbi:MAG: FadR/GntR family transcriptional regulator [Ancalomicrobiaceae bacterium]|nr:FadR/GntR family transcriptional regulator [Ancalomicrobiaceae bacterium]